MSSNIYYTQLEAMLGLVNSYDPNKNYEFKRSNI